MRIHYTHQGMINWERWGTTGMQSKLEERFLKMYVKCKVSPGNLLEGFSVSHPFFAFK